MKQRRQITAEDAAEIGEQHRHPGEKRNLFQVEAIHLEHKQRDPGVKGAPGGFRQEARQGDTPELAVAQNLTRRHFFSVAGLMLRFLAGNNVLTLFVAEFGLLFGMLIEDQPAERPNQAQHASDDKCHLPAVRHNRPHHQRRRQHSADRGADVEVAHGDGALFSREPLAARFQARRDHRRFRRADCAARQRKTAPAACHRRRGAENRPEYGKHGIADFGAEQIEHVARDRLHNGIAGGVGRHDVGVLLGGDM